MTKLKFKSALFGLIILIALSSSAQPVDANNYHHKGQHKRENLSGPKEDRMMEMLGLTEEQTKQIKQLQFDNQKKMLPMRNELDEKRAKMKTLETSDVPDMKAINSLIDEMVVLKAKKAKARAACYQEIRKILTDEQRIKFDLHAGQGKHLKFMHKS
jgi:Spy/CpxP family protein refolding chaperone